MKPIPYARQSISEADVKMVESILRSDWLTQGPAIEKFEQSAAQYCGAKYAVAVSSATAALHLSCLALGLGTGDILWTSPNSFVASANCGLYVGAAIDFVDIDAKTYNMSIDELGKKLIQAKAGGSLPKVLIPVHFAGQSCQMEAIGRMAGEYGVHVVEDASHAIGAAYRGEKVGCCRYSDLTVFSFHPVKIFTTGEGGMILANRKDLYERLLLLRSHGITRDRAKMTGEWQGDWYYEQIGLGYNYRMTDIQAALGYSQMERLESFLARRRQLVRQYNDWLAGLPLELPWQHPDADSAHHLYVVRIKTNKTRRSVFDAMRQAGILVNVHYIPIHLQPYYQQLGFRRGDFPAAEAYYDACLSLPLYYDLTDEQQGYICSCLRECLL